MTENKIKNNKQETMRTILSTSILDILLLSGTSFETRDDIEINAAPEKVWIAFVGFENYKSWNSQ